MTRDINSLKLFALGINDFIDGEMDMTHWPERSEGYKAAAAGTIPSAIIFVDGEEFIRCEQGDDYRTIFEITKNAISEDYPGQHEYALMVWKSNYASYIREKLIIK